MLIIVGILLVCRPLKDADRLRNCSGSSADQPAPMLRRSRSRTAERRNERRRKPSGERGRDLSHGFVCPHCRECAAAVARHRRRRPGPGPGGDRSGPPPPGEAQAGVHAAHRHGRSRRDRQCGHGPADRPQGRTEAVPVSQRLRRGLARRARQGRPPEEPGPARRRSGARHAAQDEDGRSDVAQVEGLRGCRSPARGAEAADPEGNKSEVA